MPLTGHCLCGQVSYSVDAEPMMTALCHCEDCQRQSGTTFSIVIAVERAAFQVQGDTLSTYRTRGTESGEERERKFCSACGSPIVTLMAESPDLAIIKAGTLDDRSWLTPEAEVWCDSEQGWLQSSQERGRFARGLPTG